MQAPLFAADGDESADEYAQNLVSFNFTKDCRAERVTVDGYMCHAFQTWDSYQTKFIDCTGINARYVTGSHGETFHIAGSTDIHVVRPTIHLCRRAIDLRSGCKNLYVDEPDISGIILHGLSYHGGYSDPVSGNFICRGGRITAAANYDDVLSERFTDPDGATTNQAGRCFHGSSDDGYLKIIGTELIGQRNGVADLLGQTEIYLYGVKMGCSDASTGFVFRCDGAGGTTSASG